MNQQEQKAVENGESETTTRSLKLYSKDAVDMLKEALQQLESQHEASQPAMASRYVPKFESSSSSSENEESEESSSSSSSEDESDQNEESTQQEQETVSELQQTPVGPSTAAQVTNKKPGQARKKPSAKQQKQNKKEASYIAKQSALVPRLAFELKENNMVLELPTALVSKHEKQLDSLSICRSIASLASSLQQDQRPVVVLLLRSGRFAGGVFVKDKCLVHRACQRYTTRRGQGKAQSSQDNSKRKAKSMGAQLRRAGEESLKQDVASTLQEWRSHLEKASLIFISCPPTMKKDLFSNVIERNDERLRKIPLDIGRPTFESVVAVYNIMMEVNVKEGTLPKDESTEEPPETASVTDTSPSTIEKPKEEKKEVIITPLTPLHTAAAEGNLSELTELIESCQEGGAINVGAGQDYMTPLHYAAASTSKGVDPSVAASCVSILLLNGGANPCLVDARNRPAYFLALYEKVRDSFRMARAQLGEEAWQWDDAKVGPPLDSAQIDLRKAKAAEKKRRQRARQKEKKQKEKAQADEAERIQKEQELQRKQEEDAKRVRDGLKPKATAATNVCDYCQKVCKGKRRSQMFHRLEYAYCSSECVLKHKRELMAAAAMSRMGG